MIRSKEEGKSRRTLVRLSCILLSVVAANSGAAAESKIFDIVLSGGRVIDPDSNLDAVRNVGISGGQIEAISQKPLAGREIVDVSGLVVSPGFIDMHAHGQNPFAARLQALDGVTTALEMELGVFPVESWYARRAGRSPINFGTTVGHRSARIKVLHGIDVGSMEPGTAMNGISGNDVDMPPPRPARWADDTMTDIEIEQLERLLEKGISEGAIGVGFGLAYTPAASREEIWRAFQVAARHGILTHVHLRHSGAIEPGSGIGALQEVLANASSTGASLHIAHITTTARKQLPLVLRMLETARKNGVDVSTEVYPWEAAQTGIGSPIFDNGWQDRTEATYSDLEWVATGERLTKETFDRYRAEQPQGAVVAHVIPAKAVDEAMASPDVIIVSDGPAYFMSRGHPRGAGSFSRALGLYARDRGVVALNDAIAKMTVIPARRLEASVPQMKRKGRVQLGMDADITIFNPEKIGARATYTEPTLPSAGIVHVLVNGTFIVKDTNFQKDINPGRAIRRQPPQMQ
jgi:N-acyl-D-aspartate/D-glutamate deacylase